MWDSYKLLWKHLLPDLYTTEYRCAFNSIQFNIIKTWFLYTSSWNIYTMNFCPIRCKCRNLLLCFRLDARISTFWYSYVIFSIKQTKIFTYTHKHLMLCSCFKYESGLKKTNMHSTATHAKITPSFGWYTQKYSKENQKQTMNIL